MSLTVSTSPPRPPVNLDRRGARHRLPSSPEHSASRTAATYLAPTQPHDPDKAELLISWTYLILQTLQALPTIPVPAASSPKAQVLEVNWLTTLNGVVPLP